MLLCSRHREPAVPLPDRRTAKAEWDGEMVSRTRTLGALALQYPMYVVRVADFMRMSDARPHQFLKAQGVAAEFRPLSSTAAFVSHQWCGVGRADPHFRQLRVLQGMFARAAAGTLRIGTDPYSRAFYTQKVTVRQEFLRTSASWAIWWDYFSVPQAEGEIADQSGPSYWMGDLGRAMSGLLLGGEGLHEAPGRRPRRRGGQLGGAHTSAPLQAAMD